MFTNKLNTGKMNNERERDDFRFLSGNLDGLFRRSFCFMILCEKLFAELIHR